MYKALYRKYRPTRFSDMVGQEHIRAILKRQCQTGKTSHAYIFCGTRGTGKTTSAKILAKAVCCLNPEDGEPCGKCEACVAIDEGYATDVLEMDAASNNSVDDIRRLCDELIYPPSSLKKRVYIIDEVHMLSASAYNALLKTLEEPPEHVMFILATTELNKIPPTILSRCQRFEFRRIPAGEIAKRLLYVAKNENIDLTEDGAYLIAAIADGAMRDGLSILESCAESTLGKTVDHAAVAEQLGIAENDVIFKLLRAVSEKKIAECLDIISEYYASAKSLSLLLDDILSAIRNMLYLRQGGEIKNLSLSENENNELRELSKLYNDEQLIYMTSVTEEAENRLSGYGQNKRLTVEVCVIQMCDARFSESPKALSARIAALEKGYVPSSSETYVKKAEVPKSESAEKKIIKSEEKPEIIVTENDIDIPAETEIADSSEPDEFPKSELVEQMSSDPAASRLIDRCDTVVKNGKLYVLSGDRFTTGLLKEKTEFIGKSAEIVTKKHYEVIITEKPKNITNIKSYIDEL